MSSFDKFVRTILPVVLIAVLVSAVLSPVSTAFAEGGDDPQTPEATETPPPQDPPGAGETTDAQTAGEAGSASDTTTESSEPPVEEEAAPPDPQFCPDGTPFGDAGCEPSRATMAEAITDWLGQAVDGVIFVEAGTFDGFIIDGYTGDTDLTVQGNADSAGTTLFTGLSKVVNSVFGKLSFVDVGFEAGLKVADTTANDGVAMDGVTGDVTLYNVDVSGASGDGVSITNHDGAVTLDTVTANNTGGDGANIDNTASTADKPVTVNNSEFSNNTSGNGLNVLSNGEVRLTTVTANGNNGEGANIDNTSSTDPQLVKFIDSFFNANGSDGMYVESSGSVYLWNVTGDQNGDDGAELYAGVGTGPQAIIICTSALTNNTGYGFAADPNTGYIKLIQVNTGGNGAGAFYAANFTNIYFADKCPFGQGGSSGSTSKTTTKSSNTKVCDLDAEEETETTFLSYGITFPPMNVADCRGIITVPLSAKGLPAALAETDLFLGGLLIKLDGCELPEDSVMTVKFTLPEVEEEGDFVVLFWDEEVGSWEEVPSAPDPADETQLIASWPKIGAFALVFR